MATLADPVPAVSRDASERIIPFRAAERPIRPTRPCFGGTWVPRSPLARRIDSTGVREALLGCDGPPARYA